jgi:ParB-like chromosome segregation protein Spo0J
MNQKQNIKQVQKVNLADLEFDQNNPRFGSEVGKVTNQTDILDLIVNEYGIDDVLSSLAVNGFFTAEPIIVRENAVTGKFTVVEGNRRLAACLILADDPRAKNQKTRRANIAKSLKHQPEQEIPAIVYGSDEDEKEIISYLGVRHIAAAQPWDSFAKAAWVAKVSDENNLTLAEVTTMIGEKTGTIARMLEGYYFVTQLIDSAKFNPEDSYRKGRGSNTKYPFSWIYTLLGSPPVKRFLGMMATDPVKSPIPAEKLDDASVLIDALFGNSAKGRRPAIDDSRDLGKLAGILDDPEKIVYLKRGETVYEIEDRFEPISDLLSEGLTECAERLKQITSALGEENIDPVEAQKYIPLIIKVRNLSKDVHERLITAISGGNLTDI